MLFKSVGNKREIIGMAVHNADTVTIPPGTPVTLVMNGTNDGLDVVLPLTANNDGYAQGFKYGVTAKSMNVGDYGYAIVFGICTDLVLEVRTRAGTSGGSSWSAVTSIPPGVMLSLDTANNAFATQVSTYGAVTASTAAAAATYTYSPKAVVAQTVSSIAGVATSSSDTRTVSTIAIQAFIRML